MQTKKFKQTKDHLEVTMNQSDNVYMMDGEEKKIIGKYETTTIQKIDLDQVQSMIEYSEAEDKKVDAQLKMIESQLEDLKDVNEKELDSKVMDECKKKLDKGSKVFKQKMAALNDYIASSNRKKNLITQKEFIDEQLTKARKELADLKEATK